MDFEIVTAFLISRWERHKVKILIGAACFVAGAVLL